MMYGKHLLVEKSITLNSRELDDMIALAKEKKLVLAEAMTIWHMPIYKKLWDIVQSGELGKVQIITMNFGSFKEYDMSNRFFNMNLAGGAMLDIGVYALSIVRSFLDEQPDDIVSLGSLLRPVRMSRQQFCSRMPRGRWQRLHSRCIQNSQSVR